MGPETTKPGTLQAKAECNMATAAGCNGAMLNSTEREIATIIVKTQEAQQYACLTISSDVISGLIRDREPNEDLDGREMPEVTYPGSDGSINAESVVADQKTTTDQLMSSCRADSTSLRFEHHG